MVNNAGHSNLLRAVYTAYNYYAEEVLMKKQQQRIFFIKSSFPHTCLRHTAMMARNKLYVLLISYYYSSSLIMGHVSHPRLFREHHITIVLCVLLWWEHWGTAFGIAKYNCSKKKIRQSSDNWLAPIHQSGWLLLFDGRRTPLVNTFLKSDTWSKN